MTTFRESYDHIFQVVYWEMLGDERIDIRHESQLEKSQKFWFQFRAHTWTARMMLEYWWEEAKNPSVLR